MSGLVALRPSYKSYQIIPETLTYLLLILLEVLVFVLAWFFLLHPIVMVVSLGVYVILMRLTRFSPWLGHPFPHLLRPIHGIIITALVLVEIAYFFTWISERFTENALIRAQYCVIITFFMLLWAFFAGITPLGVYFAYSTIAIWFVWFVTIAGTFNTPFILYMEAIAITLMGVGVWFTFTRFLWRILTKKEDYSENQPLFFRWAIVISIISLSLGIGVILLESTFSDNLKSLFFLLIYKT